MHSFVSGGTTTILFGRGRIREIGRETARFGNRVLLVTGQSSLQESGRYQQILDALTQAGCSIVELQGVQPNPRLAHAQKGIELARRHDCQVVCAVGGGSVIDTGKAICCGVPASHDVWKFFYGKKKMQEALPLTAMATLAGSGSENNSGMVLTHEELGLKLGYGNRLLAPQIAILDPECTYSATARQTAWGAVDIAAHLIEFYCNNSLTAGYFPFRLIESALHSILHNCRIALVEPNMYEARAELLWLSSLGLSGLFNAGLGRIGFPVHCIEHSIAAMKDTAHGAGLAVLLPLWIEHQAHTETEDRLEVLAQLGRQLFAIQDGAIRRLVLETAARLRECFQQLGCPTSLAELGILPADYSLLAAHSQTLARIWRLPRLNEQAVYEILSLSSS